MMTAVLILTLINTAAITYYIAWRARWMVNHEHVARSLAGLLLETYKNDLQTLNEQGVKNHIYQTYTEAAAAFGLPVGLGGIVAREAWTIIAAAIADDIQEVDEGAELYD